MESFADNRARMLERALFYGWVPLFVLALWPYTLNPCEPPKLVVTAVLVLCCAVLAFFGRTGSAGIPAGCIGRGAGLRTLFALWLGWQLFCALNSSLPENSLWSLALPALWVLAALAARRTFVQAEQAWRLAAVMVGALCAASLYGLAQHLGLDPFPWSSTTTVEYLGLPSTFGNPNFAGHALVPGILLGLALATRPRHRMLTLAAVLIMAVHLWYTGMRGGPLALAAAATLYCAWRLSGRMLGSRPGRIPVALLLTLMAGSAALGLGLSAYHRTHGTWLPITDSSLGLRYNSAYGASHMLLEHPLTGIGPGNYERLVAGSWNPFEARWYAQRGLRNDHVHCEPLEAGAEGGLPGMLLHLLLFSWALLAGLRLARDGATPDLKRFGLVTALCVFAMGVDGLFGFNLHVPVSACFFFVLLGMLDGLIGRTLPPAPERRPSALFAGRLCVLLLTVVLLAATLMRFRADTAALEDQGMQTEMGSPSPGNAKFYALKNTLLQHALTDRRNFPLDPRFPEFLGRACLAAGHFAAAEEAFQGALAKCPANPNLYAYLARALHGLAAERAGKGDWPGAAFLLKRAEVAADRSRAFCPQLAAPHDALWRIADLRAEMARQTGSDDKPQERQAVEEAHRALECGVADAAPAYRTLARTALRCEERNDAAGYLGRALDQAPSAPETWTLLDSFRQDAQQYPSLLDAVSRAYGTLKKDQAGHPAFLLAGWWLTRLYADCPGMPLAVAREVIQIAPGEPGAWGLLAETPEGGTGLSALICSERAQLIGGKPEVFAPALVDALCSDPPLGASVVLQIAGMFADKAGNLGGTSPKDRVGREFVWALPLLKELAVRSGATAGDTAGVLAACARVYSAAELWSETETACAEALPALEPDAQASLQVLRSQALSQLSRRDEALAAARAAVQTAPGRADVQWNLARQLADAGMDREAQFVYKMLLQQIPKNRPEYARVGEEYARVLRRMQASPPEAAP